MDNNYNNDQQNGYSDNPAPPQNNDYTAQANNQYGQPNNGYGPQNFDPNGQPNNGYGPQNFDPNGQPNNGYGPQNFNPNGQPNNGYGPQNFNPNGMPYGQGGYPQNPYNQPKPQLEGSVGMAVASMVLGICATLMSCCFYPVAFLLALIGLILGAVAMKKGPAGKGMAVTGLVLSIISAAIAVVFLLFAASLGLGSGLSDLF